MVRVILFDLDNTLYPLEAGVMELIAERITQFMRERLAMAPDEAARLRREYVAQYGTTLRGLQSHDGVDPDEYLSFVHDVPIEERLQPDRELDQMLAQLTPEKDIFTNSTTRHARRVLRALGIERHFARFFDIHFLDFQNKPNENAYRRVVEALGVGADECLLVEDTARNIAPARALGMRTVLVGGEATGDADFRIATILDLAKVIDQLGPHD